MHLLFCPYEKNAVRVVAVFFRSAVPYRFSFSGSLPLGGPLPLQWFSLPLGPSCVRPAACARRAPSGQRYVTLGANPRVRTYRAPIGAPTGGPIGPYRVPIRGPYRGPTGALYRGPYWAPIGAPVGAL